MSDGDFDDFGGFEVADTVELGEVSGDHANVAAQAVSPGAVGTDIAAIPWLAASLQATTENKETVELVPSTAEDKYKDLTEGGDNVTTLDWNKPTEVENTAPPSDNSSTAVTAQTELAQSITAEVNKELQEKLGQALEERNTYQRELVSLRSSNDSNAAELDKLREELKLHEEKYSKLQVKHDEELTKLREQSLNALTMTIEEYKESTRTAVMQTREACLKLSMEQLETERNKFEQLYKTQTDLMEKLSHQQKEEFNTELSKHKQALRDDMQAQLKEERTKLAETIAAEAAKSKQDKEDLKELLVQQMKSQTRESLVEIKDKNKEMVERLKDELRQLVVCESRAASDQERETSLKFWEENSSQQLKKYQESLQEVIVQQREKMDSYISEKVKLDHMNQQSQLSAIEIHLEAAANQIKALTSARTQTT